MDSLSLCRTMHPVSARRSCHAFIIHLPISRTPTLLEPSRLALACWPYGLSALGSTVAVADSGNNRILIWDAAT